MGLVGVGESVSDVGEKGEHLDDDKRYRRENFRVGSGRPTGR